MVGARIPGRMRSGFTIVELLAALMAISVAAAIVIPAHFSQGSVTLENAAILFARDVRAAQNRSAYLGLPSRIEFLADGEGYQATDWRGEVVRNPRTEEPFVRKYGENAVFEGVRIVAVDVGPGSALRFTGRGRALDGGRVTLAFGGEERVVDFETGTGEIRILGSTSGWRDLGY